MTSPRAMKSDRCRSISAIIPMYNEEANAVRIIADAGRILAEVATDWEILVVESGSTDRTRDLVLAAAAADARVVPLLQPKREGMGSALRLGYARATKDLVWHIESDSPFDLGDVRQALVYFDDYDGVIGYRTSSQREFLTGWVYSADDNLHNLIRAVYHIGYNLIIRIIFGMRVKDVNFSFKLFKTAVVKKLPLLSDGWFIDAEILLELARRGARLREIGIEYRKRQYGTSTVRLLTPLKMLGEMLAYWRTRGRLPRRDNGHA